MFRAFGPGAAAFQWWVPALVLPLCTVRHSKTFVCCNYSHQSCPTRSGGCYFWFFRTGADVSPLQGRALLRYAQIFRGQITALIHFQGINKRGLRLYCGFPDIRLLILTVICLRIFVNIVAAGEKMRRLSRIMLPDMARTDVRTALRDENREPEPAPEAPKGAGERNQFSGCR